MEMDAKWSWNVSCMVSPRNKLYRHLLLFKRTALLEF